MKGSVITSVVLHGLLLAWLLISYGSVQPLEVTAGEALPVELITDMSQLQEGAEDAPKKDHSAKEVTKNEPKVEDAKNSGDNNFDLKSVPTPMDKPSNVQKEAAAKESDVVAPQDVAEQKSDDNVKEDTAVDPSDEVAALEKPVVDVKPEPRPDDSKPVEDKPVEETKDEPLPENVPVPVTRPKVEPKQVEEKKEEPKKVEEKKVEEKKETKVADAKTDKDKKAKKDKENKKAAKTTTSKKSDFNANEITDLLNKVDNESGGARRNTKDKAAGAKTTNSNAAKLSQSEMDALKGMIEKNWSIMPGTETAGVVITVRFELDENGAIVGDLEVKGSGGDASSLSVLEGGAKRAVMRSAPFDQLPKDKYDTWKVVTVNFTPSDMM